MLDALKRLIGSKPPASEWPAVSDWARKNKLRFRRTRDDEGFVVEGGPEGKPWRLEWGPPQRAYLEGHELRMRMELGLPTDWQVMLLSQPLLEQLERQTFERFTETTQTLIDADTPEEMRWLAMYSKIPFQADRQVRARFGLIGNVVEVGTSWIEGDLARQLEVVLADALSHQPPFVMMLLRGRVYLRLQCPDPDVQTLAQMVAVFETAVLQAVRVAGGGDAAGDDWNTTSSTAWQTQLGPDDPRGRPGGR